MIEEWLKWAEEYEFQINRNNLIYHTDLPFYYNEYFFELNEDEDEVIIHYYNDPLSYTDCKEFKGKDKGSIKVPLKEFTQEIIKLAEDYINVLKKVSDINSYEYRFF